MIQSLESFFVTVATVPFKQPKWTRKVKKQVERRSTEPSTKFNGSFEEATFESRVINIWCKKKKKGTFLLLASCEVCPTEMFFGQSK